MRFTKQLSLLSGLVALVIGLPVGYAVAAASADDVPQAGEAPSTEALEQMIEAGPVTDITREGAEVDYYSEGPADAQTVRDCEQDPVEAGAGDPLLCDMVVAVADGDLEPGEYSTAEIRALDSAGEQEAGK